MYLEIIGSIIIIGYLFHLYGSRNWGYWAKRGIPYMKPKPFFGNFYTMITGQTTLLDFDKKIYNYFKGHKLGGYFEISTPVLWIIDPDLIRLVLVKDFDYFVNRKTTGFEDDAYFSSTVSGARDHHWKALRSFTSPTFTSGKIKKMFPFITSCGDNCINYMKNAAKTGETVDVKDMYGKLTVDVVAAAAYGLQVNSYKDPNAKFPTMAGKIMSPSWKLIMKAICYLFAPKLSGFIKGSIFDTDALNFFTDVTLSTVEYRDRNNIKGNDFLQLLSDARKGELEKDEDEDAGASDLGKQKLELTDIELVAQGLQFFSAGYETTSNFLTFLTFELAHNQYVQEKLRKEVQRVLEKHQEVSYDAIQEMEYMDMVINETHRLYPVLGRIDRTCVKDYKIPGTDIVIEKGMTIAVNIVGPHYDPDYFPDPEKFDPDRFSKEESSKRHPYVFLPFGEGPRHCIGMRFALIEIKAVVAKFISTLSVTTSEKTVSPIPFVKGYPITKPNSAVWLKFQNLE